MAEQLDEFHGQGGSYTVDPKTGKRVLTERTEEASEQPKTDAAKAVKGD